MRQRLQVKTLLIATSLGVKLTMKIVTTKKPCFEQLCRFFNYPFTLRLLHTYIYVFRAFFGFFNFYATCCCFFIVVVKLFHSTLNFEQQKPGFLASQCTTLLLSSKEVQINYKHFFNVFKPKSALHVLMKLRLPTEMLLMETIL